MRKLEAVDRVNFSGFITAIGGDIEVLTMEELLSALCALLSPTRAQGPNSGVSIQSVSGPGLGERGGP